MSCCASPVDMVYTSQRSGGVALGRGSFMDVRRSLTREIAYGRQHRSTLTSMLIRIFILSVVPNREYPDHRNTA